MSNHANAIGAPSAPRLAESLPELIEQVGNELAVLEQSVNQARELANRLHGDYPRDVKAANLTAVQAEPGALLQRLRDRLSRFEQLNSDMTRELSRLGAGL